jgi:pyrroline-5-carboxylate reductase
MKITFIGGGNMAQAIIGGLAARGYAASDVTAVEPVPEARERITKLGARAVATPADAAPYGDLVVMAVKPQQMREAAAAVRGQLKRELVLSIAAGIRLADLSRWLGGHQVLARCMPNTPALVGLGVTGLYCAPQVPDAGKRLATEVLQAVGSVVSVDTEAMLDPVTAISGSGPAYVFAFIEALQQAAIELGFNAAQARELAIGTFVGAARLAADSSDDVATLRQRVTSKGGTTERALASLQSDGVANAIVKAARAANERAHELGDQLGKDA